jgi:hypothetical protein
MMMSSFFAAIIAGCGIIYRLAQEIGILARQLRRFAASLYPRR